MFLPTGVLLFTKQNIYIAPFLKLQSHLNNINVLGYYFFSDTYNSKQKLLQKLFCIEIHTTLGCHLEIGVSKNYKIF